MKKFFSIGFILFSVYTLKAQTATSISNGNWLNPLTWDCFCIPTPGYSVTINHNVILDTDFACPQGFIVINSTGSLIQNNPNRNLWIYGHSYLLNHGTLTVKNILYEGITAKLLNTGSITAGNLHLTNGMNNYGTVTADSLYNNDTIINSATINAYAFFNAMQCINTGTMSFFNFTNDRDFLNSNGVINCTNSMWNKGFFVNNELSYVTIGNDLLNSNLQYANATLFNDGQIRINSGFYNFDTIVGYTGYFQVADSSFNQGIMKGNFDFCDLTPPPSAPYIDIQIGVVEPGITWCTQQNISEQNSSPFVIFPNPANNYIDISGNTIGATFRMFDSTGKQVMLLQGNNSPYTINIENLQQGIYFLQLQTDTEFQTHKIIIQR